MNNNQFWLTGRLPIAAFTIAAFSGWLSLLLLLTLPAEAQEVLGWLEKLQGTVQVNGKDDRWRSGYPGMALHWGDLLRLSHHAQAEVRCANGKRWRVPQGTVGVNSECTARKATPTPDGSRPPGRQGDEILVASRPYLITPRETALLDPLPRLRWNAVAGITTYQLTLEQDGKQVWQTLVTGTELPYPPSAPALQPGKTYHLSVTTVAGTARSHTTFRLLDEGEQANLRAAIAHLSNQAGDADIQALILVRFYDDSGLKAATIDLLESRVQAGSQSIAIFQQLGAAYQQIGLNSFAQTQFLQALKLAPLASRARAAIQARLIALAHHDIELKRYDDAIALLQQIGKSEDDRINYDRWVVLAWAELGENRLREATANLQAAIAINPDRTEAYCVLATVLTQQQDQGANAANQRCNNDSPKSKP